MAKYFNSVETKDLNPRLVSMLDTMREYAEMPITITCGYRTPEKNKEVGGVANSSHTRGYAADLRCGDSITRYKLVKAAMLAGFRRIEVAPKHIHVCADPSLPQNILWIGESN